MRRLASAGARAVVSVHLSSEVSGTFESAELAGKQAPIPVHVVDSRQLGMATGFAVQSAAEALDHGGGAEEAADAARARAAAMTALFYVDTLEHLRRGGRVGAAAALLGSALAVKPLLKVEDGRIVALEKVRTSAKALHRLQELAVAAAGDEEVDVAVSHLANADGAEALASQLRAATDPAGRGGGHTGWRCDRSACGARDVGGCGGSPPRPYRLTSPALHKATAPPSCPQPFSSGCLPF
ncbi:MAG: DegV family protein [Nocardioidaceae bacterium]